VISKSAEAVIMWAVSLDPFLECDEK